MGFHRFRLWLFMFDHFVVGWEWGMGLPFHGFHRWLFTFDHFVVGWEWGIGFAVPWVSPHGYSGSTTSWSGGNGGWV